MGLTLEEFLKTCEGHWRSQRIYRYEPFDQRPQFIETDFRVRRLPEGYILKKANNGVETSEIFYHPGFEVMWSSVDLKTQKQCSYGTLNCQYVLKNPYDGHIWRDRGYMTKKSTTSAFVMADTRLVTNTVYDGKEFNEVIELIGDNLRARRTKSGRLGSNTYNLLGVYSEVKIAELLEDERLVND